MSGYVLAMGAAPVHLGALTAWLRTRAKWLRLNVMPDASGSHNVYLRVGGPYASPDMAYEAARLFREVCGEPIGLTRQWARTTTSRTRRPSGSTSPEPPRRRRRPMPDDLPTALTDPPAVGTDDLTAEENAAADDIVGDLAPVAPLPADWLQRGTQPRQGLESAVYLTRIRDSILPWHAYTTPPAVAELRAKLEELMAADQAARAEWAEIPQREAAERKAIGAAAVAGEPIPVRTDWETVKLVSQARHEELARRVKAAHAAYLQAVQQSLPEWRAALVGEVGKRRTEARKAYAGVRQAVDAWQQAIAAGHAIDAALHPGDELPTSPLPPEVGELLGRGKAAAAALDAFLTSEHPVVSGEYLQRKDSLRPQAYIREALAETYSGMTQLANVETAEHYRFTQHSREFTSRYYVDQFGDARERPSWSESASSIPSASTAIRPTELT